MKKTPIKELKELVKNIVDENDQIMIDLLHDTRKGAQYIYEQWKREKGLKEKELQRYKGMCKLEVIAQTEGYEAIAGIDEAGRGPLAGPVVSAAVILKKDSFIEGLNDSKKISKKKRMLLYEAILAEAVSVGVGIIDSKEIDQMNIYEATKKSMLAAVQNLKRQPDILFIDAMTLNSPYPERSFIKGDAISVSIAAASIIAKVTRDEIMTRYHQEYPEYGFIDHMGYGTKNHVDAIHTYGACPIHRTSFEPIKSMLI
ncbi:ribonuclease HII [Bacillus sp. FSL K6-3431]|uniref:ribonuclease HII n=1 Tax=Bacillus sp. FSL K6-3431 TaxID=2921500 RepID=UPI0030F66274